MGVWTSSKYCRDSLLCLFSCGATCQSVLWNNRLLIGPHEGIAPVYVNARIKEEEEGGVTKMFWSKLVTSALPQHSSVLAGNAN